MVIYGHDRVLARGLEEETPTLASGAWPLPWYQIEAVRHPAELGKRTRLHLPNQVSAMHLHRGFGDADIIGDLFVQATGHNVEHDFTLSGAERAETLPERGQSSVPLPSGTIASQSGLDGLNEVLITKRFRQELYGAPLHRLHGHGHIGTRLFAATRSR